MLGSQVTPDPTPSNKREVYAFSVGGRNPGRRAGRVRGQSRVTVFTHILECLHQKKGGENDKIWEMETHLPNKL